MSEEEWETFSFYKARQRENEVTVSDGKNEYVLVLHKYPPFTVHLVYNDGAVEVHTIFNMCHLYDIFSGCCLRSWWKQSLQRIPYPLAGKDTLRCLLTALLACKSSLLCKGIYDPRVFLLVFKFINQR